VVRAEDIDERHIKLLPATERRRRLAIVAQELARARYRLKRQMRFRSSPQ